ncbi:MAG: DnaJ C-terminal domain-containing protein [Candidatus Aminicenantales bacterium]
MFRNPHAQDLFRELNEEFEKYGFRFDQRFVDRVFFGGRGIFFGGFFFGGPMFGHKPFPQGLDGTSYFRRRPEGRTLRQERAGGGFLSRLGRKIGTLLLGYTPEHVAGNRGLDMTYHLTLSRQEAASGSKIRIAYKRGKTSEKLDVTIPPGIKSGSRLRLRGKGVPHPRGGPPGDLYLHIELTD